MLANSDNQQDLVSHLIAVGICARQLATDLGASKDIQDACFIAGVMHDIGKAADPHQDNICKGVTIPDDYPRHNEISWAFTHKRLESGLVREIKSAIYWHHAANISIDNRRSDNIDDIASDSYEKIESVLTDIIGRTGVKIGLGENRGSTGVIGPYYYSADSSDNEVSMAKAMVIRSCLVYADHSISSLCKGDVEDIANGGELPDFGIHRTHSDMNCPNGYDNGRFEKQVEIVNECGRTTVVSAPAGFGKTIIGLLWGLKKGKQIYWVCPRNAVAESVYHNIENEIKKFGLDISIELYLTSEQVKRNKGVDACGADIVITNIDNLLAPTVSGRMGRMFHVMNSSIIYDEYHELVSDEGLFALFTTHMMARHCVCKNSETLLLSATPGVMHLLWDGAEKTKVLPDNYRSYGAQHSCVYEISHGNFEEVEIGDGSLRMHVSISRAQEGYSSRQHTGLIHSKYTDSDRVEKIEKIYEVFGRDGLKDGSIISAPIIQASMDISFRSLQKSIESPESDLQTIGRLNRWGENRSARVLFVDASNDRNERGAIQARYDVKLSKKWVNHLRGVNHQVTLDDLYNEYWKFQKENKDVIIRWLKDKRVRAHEKLSSFYPKKPGKKIDNVQFAARTVRNSAGSIFIVVRDTDGNWMDSVFSISREEIDSDLIAKSYYENVSRYEKAIKKLDKMDCYDYKLGKVTKLDKKYKDYGKWSDSPAPIFHLEYDKVLGLKKAE